MHNFALIYYMTSLVFGLAAMLCLLPITWRTRNSFFIRYLLFDAFYFLLISLSLASLYTEANYPGWFTSGGAWLKLAIFTVKCCLAYTLLAFTQRMYNLQKVRALNVAVFFILFTALTVRLVGFFNILPEEGETGPAAIPISRIVVDAAIILDLLFLFVLRFFRLREIPQAEFRTLMRRITLIIAAFAPPLVVEVLFYRQWGFAVVAPAMYCVVSAFFLMSLSSYFADHYRLPGTDVAPLDAFARRYGISSREREIVASMMKGDTNKSISKLLFISPSTVKAHVYNIFRKCGVKTRHQLFFKILNKE